MCPLWHGASVEKLLTTAHGFFGCNCCIFWNAGFIDERIILLLNVPIQAGLATALPQHKYIDGIAQI
jgi:hypothetical protein